MEYKKYSLTIQLELECMQNEERLIHAKMLQLGFSGPQQGSWFVMRSTGSSAKQLYALSHSLLLLLFVGKLSLPYF